MSTDETQPLPGDPAPHSAGSSRERRLDEAIAAYLASIGSGSSPDPRPWLERYPDLSDDLRLFFADHGRMEDLARPVRAATAAGLPVGSRVHYVGDYELLRELGRGGMGVVYEARQVSLNRIVAVKMILAGELATPTEVERFYAEARTAATLQHPNIVALHEVGQHEGQHYFSMDYVAGQSLAEIVREQPLVPERAARYIQAVAEAIQHAHEQGILHRDLKPSNVLIDRFDQPRVTDFGLAKRVTGDDPRTATGAVLGTPSYMPPEQASSDRGEVGPASDVYSLGATLYELVTGRPPFRAATMLETLIQVRDADPAPPRSLNPAVNRDLETIILKCLAKESAGRYPTAQELADDLGRFLRDEPIHARRPGPLERAWRWTKSHRGTVATIAATVIFVLLALQGVALYRYLNQGALRLGTDDVDLTAQILDLDGRPVIEPYRVPTTSDVLVPPGEYQLRLAATGLPSETWPLEIARWGGSGHQVRLRSRMLWPPIESSRQTQQFLLSGKDRTDLLLLDSPARRLRCIHGATGRPLWPDDLVLDASQMPTGGAPARLVLPAPDLDGDGVSDIVLSFPNPAILVAVSGKEGNFLWRHVCPERFEITATPGIVHGAGDKHPDLVLGLSTWDRAEIRALSGETGQPLWSYPIDKEWLGEPPQGESLLFNAWTIQPQAADVGGSPAVVFFAGAKLAAVDARTGQELWPPKELGLALFRAPQLAEFDGQPGPDVLLCGLRLDHFDSAGFGLDARHRRAPDRQPQLTAVALDERQVLWQVPLPSPQHGVEWYHLKSGAQNWPNELPQVVDLEGDGKAEALAVVGNANYDSAGQPPWSGIAVLDGVTGRERWRRRLTSPVHGGAHHSDKPIAYFLAGPDTSGDGCREIFVPWMTFDDEAWSRALVVACLSGADGRPLWIEKTGSPVGDPSGRPFLGSIGDDGWSLLIVPQGGTATMHALSTGRHQQVLSGTHGLAAADLDGNDSPDLLYSVEPQGAARILAIAGRPAETWRQLGGFKVAQDFDGDELPDLLDDSRGGVLTAHGGSDGRRLWETRAAFREPHSAISAPLPHGDLDADGIADIVGFTGVVERLSGGPVMHAITALSGASGRRLWTASDFQPSGGGGSGGTARKVSLPHLVWHDLDGDGRGEILLVHRRGMQGNSSDPLELVVLAGGNGRRLWQTNISEIHLERPANLDDGCRDLNGDGAGDLVLWVPRQDSPRWEGGENLCALSGRDGKVLWTVEPNAAEKLTSLRPPVIDDVDRDGIPDIVAMRYSLSPQEPETILVNGRTGEIQWRWTSDNLDSSIQSPLVAQLDADGSKSILIETPADPWQVTLLSASGQVRRQISMRPMWHSALNSGWLAVDLTGDGRQEVLVVADQKLRTLEGDDLHVLWERQIEDAARVLQIIPAEKGQAATVVLSSGGEVLGLDGRTARPRWRCDLGPGTSPAGLLPAADKEAQSLPQIIVHEPGGWATICRPALAVTEGGTLQPPKPRPITPSAAADLSLSRPLPWYLTGSFQQQVAPLAAWNDMTRTYFASSPMQPRVLFSPATALLMVVIIPWILWRLRQQRVPRMSEVLPAYLLLIAGPYLAWMMFGLVIRSPLWLVLFPVVLLATAAMCIPYLMFARFLWQSLERRQWWWAALLLGGSLVLAAAFATVLLRIDAAVRLPEERYQWTGWYLIWFQTVYALGLMLLLVAIVQWAAKWLSRLRTTFTRRRNRHGIV